MQKLDAIAARSHSDSELVLSYADAMDVLATLEEESLRVMAWEGWVLYPNGTLGHSQKHQGTIELSSLSASETTRLAKATIQEAYRDWHTDPEVRDGELLFCITLET